MHTTKGILYVNMIEDILQTTKLEESYEGLLKRNNKNSTSSLMQCLREINGKTPTFEHYVGAKLDSLLEQDHTIHSDDAIHKVCQEIKTDLEDNLIVESEEKKRLIGQAIMTFHDNLQKELIDTNYGLGIYHPQKMSASQFANKHNMPKTKALALKMDAMKRLKKTPVGQYIKEQDSLLTDTMIKEYFNKPLNLDGIDYQIPMELFNEGIDCLEIPVKSMNDLHNTSIAHLGYFHGKTNKDIKQDHRRIHPRTIKALETAIPNLVNMYIRG